MTVYYSDYVPVAASAGVEGRSQVDLTSTSFADLFAQASDYLSTTTYSKGKLVYNQGAIWVYVNNTPSSGTAPPTLPTVSNTHWEMVGTSVNSTFTWIVYANSVDGTTFADFTVGSSTESGITRRWIGIANNKTSAVESTNPADYSWSRFVGDNGLPGASFYTWYAYSDSGDGVVNFTTGAPGTRSYQGIAPNKTTISEGTNPADYTWSPYVGPPGFGLASANGGEVSGAKILKRSGVNWDAQVYSTESFVGGAFVSFKPELNGDGTYGGVMVGLNTDPTSLDWSTIDHAIYLLNGTSTLQVAESGVLTTVGTYASSDTFSVHYDGANVRYSKNGTVFRTVSASAGTRFFLDSAMTGASGVKATITAWSAAGSVGPQGNAGAAATSAYLTNETVQLYAYSSGNVVNYNGATGIFKVFAGSTDISSSFSLSTLANPQALNMSYIGQTYAVVGGLDVNEDTATVTIRATGSGAYAGASFDKVFSLGKIKAGIEPMASLTANNDSTNFDGRFAYSGGKLYRFTGSPGAGGGWTASVPTADLTGQIIENQIANASVGSSKLKIGVGSNMLIGAVPGTNPNRYIALSWNPDNVTSWQTGGDGGLLLSPAFGSDFPSAYSSWTTPDGGTFAVRQTNATPNNTTGVGVCDFNFKYPNDTGTGESNFFPVEAGKTYEFSAYTGAHRCNVELIIVWHDQNNNQTPPHPASGANANNVLGGVSLTSYQRLVARGVAPAGATKAILVARKGHTYNGQVDSWMFLNRPMFAETVAGATEALPYNPPPVGLFNAENIRSNSILTRHLKADIIETQHLKTDSVTVRNLLVQASSLMPDPQFRDLTLWYQDNEGGTTGDGTLDAGGSSTGWYPEETSAPANAVRGTRYLVLWSGRGGQDNNTRFGLYSRAEIGNGFRPQTNSTYELKVNVENGSNQWVAITIEWINLDYTTSVGDAAIFVQPGQSGTFTVQATPPANASYGRIKLFNQAVVGGGPTFSGTIIVSNISIRDTIGSTMIADNAVVQGKLAANAVLANNIAAGQIDASKIAVTQLSAISATVGLLRTATSGARLEIENNQIRVYDGSNVLRVRMGVW